MTTAAVTAPSPVAPSGVTEPNLDGPAALLRMVDAAPFSHEFVEAAWRRFVTGLDPARAHWLRSTEETLASFLAQTRPYGAYPYRLRSAEDCVHHGLAVADLLAYDLTTMMGDEGPARACQDLISRFNSDLAVLAETWPQVSVRAAVAWVVIAAQCGDQAPALLVNRWSPVPGAGIETGWIFEAAGLTPDEAATALAAGTLDADRARALAGLRGVRLPAA